MMRAALAVIAGFALWSGLWLGGNMVLSGAFPGPASATSTPGIGPELVSWLRLITPRSR